MEARFRAPSGLFAREFVVSTLAFASGASAQNQDQTRRLLVSHFGRSPVGII